MKLIYLLRHAKSSWDDPGIDDFDRPLNKRGRKAAQQLADHFRNLGIRPDCILCSPAQRSRQTLAPLLPLMGEIRPIFELRLYEASRLTLQALLSERPQHCRSVLLIGHNPGLQRLVLHLAKNEPVDANLRVLDDKFPTGGLVTLSAAIDDWGVLAAHGCTLESFIRPSDLEG